MSFSDVAGALSRAAGFPACDAPISAEHFHAELEPAAGSVFADTVTDIARETFDGRNALATGGVERTLGCAPVDFNPFAAGRPAPAHGAPLPDLSSRPHQERKSS